jgi:hypothetical protein
MWVIEYLGLKLISQFTVESKANKSLFIPIQLSVDKLVGVFPVVPISLGDLSGIFSSKVRFS